MLNSQCVVCHEEVPLAPENIVWDDPSWKEYRLHKLCATIVVGLVCDRHSPLYDDELKEIASEFFQDLKTKVVVEDD